MQRRVQGVEMEEELVGLKAELCSTSLPSSRLRWPWEWWVKWAVVVYECTWCAESSYYCPSMPVFEKFAHFSLRYHPWTPCPLIVCPMAVWSAIAAWYRTSLTQSCIWRSTRLPTHNPGTRWGELWYQWSSLQSATHTFSLSLCHLSLLSVQITQCGMYRDVTDQPVSPCILT